MYEFLEATTTIRFQIQGDMNIDGKALPRRESCQMSVSGMGNLRRMARKDAIPCHDRHIKWESALAPSRQLKQRCQLYTSGLRPASFPSARSLAWVLRPSPLVATVLVPAKALAEMAMGVLVCCRFMSKMRCSFYAIIDHPFVGEVRR